jgi:NAD-dependent SIR2 family protein deacetylase
MSRFGIMRLWIGFASVACCLLLVACCLLLLLLLLLTILTIRKGREMKARDIFKNKDGQTGELTHKLRTVTDLIRHIKTKEESSSGNYSIFLGAGASVSSGIRTASQLTDEWANELYERFMSERSKSAIDAKAYFEKEHPSWYNSDNPYSSLFEKKFDLPTQRRRFVEQEVDSKLPSIGYSYLVSLVDNHYFNTIFTTNFDDLINEAFYVFSNKRPIVCAHDSSIRSVSITSKRPKIVKLHGDYLFDDIKSTLRETESLEQNTKEKFVEFCKEYGLIVVGYSGCDRSIMDVLEFLVKQESYLKNGIYWCLRPGDEVCHNLRNLIWKDKVYPVLVDGFDELFAEIHSEAVGKELNLNSSTKQSKLEMAIRQIVEDRYGLSKNDVIGKEILSIKEDGDSKDISGFIKQLSQANESSRLGIKDVRNLLEIESLTENLELENAIEICNTHYQEASSAVEKRIYIERFIDLYIKKGVGEKVGYWCDKLIELDPNNIGYHLKKANSIKNLVERSEYYTMMVAKFPYSTSVRVNAANTLIRRLRQANDNVKKLSCEARKHLDEGLSIDPSLDNPAWEKKLELLSLLYHQTKNASEAKAFKDEVDELTKAARTRHPEHQQTLDLLASQLDFSCTAAELSGLLQFFSELRKKSSINKKKAIDITRLKIFSHIYKVEENEMLKAEIAAFFKDYVPDQRPEVQITLAKIRYLITIEKDPISAKVELDALLLTRKLGMYIDEILELPIAFSERELTILRSKLELDRFELLETYYYETLSEILVRSGQYEAANENIEIAFAEGISLEQYLSKLTYLLLKSQEYGKILALSHRYKDKLSTIDAEAFEINVQAAAKKSGSSNYSPVALRNLIAHSKSDSVKMCAFSLLDQFSDARRLVKKQLEIDSGLIIRYLDWPALADECIPDEYAIKVDVA